MCHATAIDELARVQPRSLGCDNSPVNPVSDSSADAWIATRLAAIVESSDDAIVSKDLNGIVQTWNPAAERMLGYTAGEMIGRSIRCIIPPDRQGEEDEVLSRIRRGEGIDHYETVRMRKDGSLIDVSLSVSPIRAQDGRIIGASKIARDITEQKRVLRELEAANRSKEEFLANLSHELRTPLNAILGYARILRTPGMDPEAQQRAAEVIERNGIMLSKLVSDVLDISRIAAGKTRLNRRKSDVVAVLDAAIDVIRPAADAKGVQLERDIPVDKASVVVDPDRIQQVMWNLLTNAIKFTPRGGRITLRLRVNPGELVVSVIDTGDGIERSVLPHVFQRFRQGELGTSREQGGLGLGLALVRHFVELHGGRVTASSDGPGQGATFVVVLPTPPTDPA
jgi:PAS domain S-box-containing protein